MTDRRDAILEPLLRGDLAESERIELAMHPEQPVETARRTLRLPRSLDDRLVALAEATGQSVNTVVELILWDRLDR